MKTQLARALSYNGDPESDRRGLSEEVEQSPRLGTEFLLLQLNHLRWKDLSVSWRRCIVTFGLALTALQRAERLVSASTAGKTLELTSEWRNKGHCNWDPLEYPESLLLEVENGIMIRRVQEQVAAKMREPPDGENSSMQLNMGEGKSSVIVPMVAAALADGSRLLRVIVAKPQSKQMAQMLVSKLGGLINRRVYFLPFSRSLALDIVAAQALDTICRECMARGGVLLVQPEHLLSFQLMVLERSICGDVVVGRALLRTQEFFDHHSRDVVDESDENFNPRFELIYTIGVQRQLEFCPDRWTCIGEIMDLVQEMVPEIARQLPTSVRVESSVSGSFPLTRILRSDAARMLVSRIAGRICETGLVGFPISRQGEATRRAVFTYITEPDLSQAEVDSVENDSSCGFWTEALRPKLLLLRGLLACGILVFVLGRKRWCVNYGLDPNRKPATRLAVPYRAKDQPSPRSDFSHPDVTILLTYLSYYYGYLRMDEVYLTFEHLMESDHRDIDYQEWIKDLPDLPVAFRHLQGVNLKDGPACTSIVFPHLSKSKNVIDYFLSHVVFPKELRVFPHKLCASGWDIGRTKHMPTTAFSGTCDAYPLLPLDVIHLDLPQQQHTNALVLNYLLRPENSIALLPSKPAEGMSDAEWLLSMTMNPQIATRRTPRVILDVGAQILDSDNQGVAQGWLHMHTPDSAEAAIFFNDQDEPSVLDRQGNVERLQISPFAKRLEVCLVFLDEAHTRGIDFKLPIDYCAAVTLGPNVTKDRLVQACMRMRQLGKGQSVIFLVSEEIQTKIHDCLPETIHRDIVVADVLHWTIKETLDDVRRSLPLWAKQGKNFVRQQALWASRQIPGTVSKEEASSFLEEEAKTLEQRYRPRLQAESGSGFANLSADHRLTGISRRYQEAAITHDLNSSMEEEQEKELSPEMQEERQIEKPPPAVPAKHHLHADVVKYVVDGIYLQDSQAYEPAFTSLSTISAAAHFDVCQLVGKRQILVTKDFTRTVKQTPSSVSDTYLRSVQWMLTFTKTENNASTSPALIISPYEAQQLMPRLRQSCKAVLHIYKPHWNILHPPLNRLNFFRFPPSSIPRMPLTTSMAQLDLFAGRSHFSCFDEYVETCNFLGLASNAADTEITTSADGFILHTKSAPLSPMSVLRRSPVAFVKALTSIRANHRDFVKTDMGKVLSGVLLAPRDFKMRE